eukprot:m.299460 g.299460  ORF g.299460 m.299460 type:complete len:345 (-) comp14139_c0_seq1:97-1131(-)
MAKGEGDDAPAPKRRRTSHRRQRDAPEEGKSSFPSPDEFEQQRLGQSLCTAAWDGDHQKVIDLLEKVPVDFRCILENRHLDLPRGLQLQTNVLGKRTALHNAARKGHLTIVQLLVSRGADIHDPTTYKDLPLHEAARQGAVDVLDFLIPRAHDVDQPECDGLSPLLCAISYNQAAAVRVLLDAGANPDFCDAKKMTGLHWTSDPEITKMLVWRGANMHAVDGRGHFPVVTMMSQRSHDAVRVLIDHGLNLELVLRSKYTPPPYMSSLRHANNEFWTLARHKAFPRECQMVMRTLIICKKYLPVFLPDDIWLHVMTFLSRGDFGCFTHEPGRWSSAQLSFPTVKT